MSASLTSLGAAPHPYPLPVKDRERGIAGVAACLLSPFFTGRECRQAGEGRHCPYGETTA